MSARARKLRETMDRLCRLHTKATPGPWGMFAFDEKPNSVGIGTHNYSDVGHDEIEARVANPTPDASDDFAFVVELVNAFDEIDAAMREIWAIAEFVGKDMEAPK